MSRKIDRTSSTTSRWMSRATGEPMWRLSSQKREIVLAITVGIADQRHGQQRQAPHFPPPFACPDPAPSVPPRLGLSIVGMRVATAGLLGLCPRATAANAASAPQGMHASQLTMPMAPVLIPLVEFEACNAGAPHILSHPTASYMHERICSIYNSSRNHR